MTPRRRVSLLLTCLVSALACAQTTVAFSHGDLLLSSFSGKALSTLQLVVPAPPLSAFFSCVTRRAARPA